MAREKVVATLQPNTGHHQRHITKNHIAELIPNKACSAQMHGTPEMFTFTLLAEQAGANLVSI